MQNVNELVAHLCDRMQIALFVFYCRHCDVDLLRLISLPERLSLQFFHLLFHDRLNGGAGVVDPLSDLRAVFRRYVFHSL